MGDRYDFYICHDEEDSALAHTILERLESQYGMRGFHEDRDGNGGQTFIRILEHAIQSSRYIVVLISDSALTNNWFELKVQASLLHRLENPELMSTVVPIYVNMPSDLPSSLRVIVGLEYTDDEFFWTKLQQTLSS